MALVGIASLNHRLLHELSSAEVRTEVVEAKKQIEELTQRPCATFAYPAGFFSEAAKAIIKDAGHTAAFTTFYGPNDHIDLFALNRTEILRRDRFQFQFRKKVEALRVEPPAVAVAARSTCRVPGRLRGSSPTVGRAQVARGKPSSRSGTAPAIREGLYVAAHGPHLALPRRVSQQGIIGSYDLIDHLPGIPPQCIFIGTPLCPSTPYDRCDVTIASDWALDDRPKSCRLISLRYAT